MPQIRRCWPIAIAALLAAGLAHADSAAIAVAANFATPVAALKRSFEARTGHRLTIASGSTGQLYAQIKSGAPFDALLAADVEHVDRLVADGLGDSAVRFTYAVGRLVLWTRDAGKYAPLGMDTVKRTDFRWLAIANPRLAPYGAAAQETLTALGLWDALQPRLVRGENIAQTFTMAETRNADLAFVALSQALTYQEPAAYVEVPAELYTPIRQDAILLKRADSNAAARAFLDYLRSAEGAREIERFGYAVGLTVSQRD